METFKKNWFVILLILAIGGGLFYWYGYRPTQIRHDCSWVLRKNILPAKRDCPEHLPPESTEYTDGDSENTRFAKQFRKSRWENGEYQQCLEEQKTLPLREKEPKEYWGKATDKEYDFCIQESGLR